MEKIFIFGGLLLTCTLGAFFALIFTSNIKNNTARLIIGIIVAFIIGYGAIGLISLDYKTDAVLRHNLKKNKKDATMLIVAQRIGTIMNADKIMVLDNGKCVGIGTHKELLKNCEVYKEIALSQLSKEELENA